MVWDRILGFNVFPADVAQREAAFYRTKMNRYGLPLDSRANSQQPARDGMAKSDWMIWSATLGGSRRNLEALAGSLYDFYNETPDRTPMTDWFSTVTGRRIGFDARPVVGGVFLPFLGEAALWKKWSSRDKANPREHIWAPPPKKVEATITPVVPAADTEPASWRYTTDKPSEDWMKPAFDDSGWSEGTSGFGRPGTPGARIGTQWRTSDIWLRRTVSIPADAPTALQLFVHHDEDAEIYLNDVPAARLSGFTTKYELVEPASAKAAAALQPGAKIVLAAHCHNGRLGQYIDVGVVAVEYKE
ncbi:MAG: DUF1793 domain-containing protein [Candidatus Sumerlaeota bacterium]|nr:DUF1793 domain-containing protein [Candidatus Sumerlaeota bacterium]